MFCTECGSKIEDDCVYCSNCGAKITQVAGPAPRAENMKEETIDNTTEAEAPKAEAPKAEAPKAEAPKAEAPKVEAPKAEAPKAEVSKAEVSKTEEPPKKSHALLIVGTCFAAFFFLLIVGCGVVLKKYWDSVDEKKGKKSKEVASIESTAMPEPVATPEPTAEPAATPEPTVAPTATPEVTATPEPTGDTEQLFHICEYELLKEKSQIRLAPEYCYLLNSYNAPYVDVDELYGPASKFDRNVYGALKTEIIDMDGDGEEEMLAIGVNEGSMEYWVYELEGEEVKPAAGYNGIRKENQIPMFDKNDEMELNVYLHQKDGYYFLIERFDMHRDWDMGYDGAYLGVCFYDGQRWHAVLSEYRTGMDDASFQADEEYLSMLRELGLTESASKCKLVGDPLSTEDGLLEILYVTAMRTEDEVRRDRKVFDHEKKNVADLSGVSYYFFDDKAEFEESDLKSRYVFNTDHLTDYQIERIDHSIPQTEERSGIVNYCDHVKFLGDDEKLTSWLNEMVENAVKEYDNDEILEEMEEEYREFQDRDLHPWTGTYSPLQLVKLYAEGDYLSLGYVWDWSMGGVHNLGGFGLNYHLKEKRVVTLEEILGMDEDEVFKLVAEKIDDYYGKDLSTNEIGFDDKVLREFVDQYGYPFWFDKEKVYLIFGSYDLHQGAGWYQIEILRE